MGLSPRKPGRNSLIRHHLTCPLQGVHSSPNAKDITRAIPTMADLFHPEMIMTRLPMSGWNTIRATPHLMFHQEAIDNSPVAIPTLFGLRIDGRSRPCYEHLNFFRGLDGGRQRGSILLGRSSPLG